jgi:TRAP-type C4-dicarboxylate transport system permease small subunit
MMAKINAIIDRILFILLGVLLAGLVIICLAQVIARYVFNASFSWAEEISIVILLWAAWGGACLALRGNAHLRMNLLEERLRPKSRAGLRLILNFMVIVFLAIIALTSRFTIDAMANITLGSLSSVPINIMYWSVPVGCLLLIYYIFRSMVKEWQTLCEIRKKGY